MKRANTILLLFLFLLINQFVSSQSKESTLPVFDLSKTYSLKKAFLHEMADIEYVPLETTDDLLISGDAVLSSVTEKYILVHEPRRGDIFIFDRKTGKIVSHFNHKGPSGMEYAWIKNGVVFDSKTEEIYVCSQYIQVYSLKGEYKRTLKINGFTNDMKVFDYDDKSLLVYYDVIIEPGREDKTKQDPYHLVSKQDGSLVSVLNLHFSKRYSNKIAERQGDMWRPIILSYPLNMYYGSDLMIADISSDTLFQLSPEKGLCPIMVRKPSVHASEPRSIWMPLLTTDKFMLIGTMPLDFATRRLNGKSLMYDIETGEIVDQSILDPEFSVKTFGGVGEWYFKYSPAIAKNKVAELIQATSMLEAYNGKRLKGNGMKVAKEIQEDDNPVVRILTFK